MNVIRGISDFDRVKPGCVLTIGNFDGVHAGHQEILRVAGKMAQARNTRVVVMTFEPHPVAVLFPEKAPRVLTPLARKLELLQPYADSVVVLEDSRDLLAMSARDFVEQFLMPHLQPCAMVEGHDFHFGAKRSGNVDTLRDLGEEFGFDVRIVPPYNITFTTDQCIRVSSTIIRYMLESGHVQDAAQALGSPFRLTGPIVTGRGKGREIGFPTLNLGIPDQVIPAEGVYAGTVELGADAADLAGLRQRFPAVFSIGQARTFGDTIPLLIEAHLLDHQVPDTRSRWMAMDFVAYLRSQHRYGTVEELVGQIGEDCAQASRVLAQLK
jgi:riboflavin kinase/FMN adenylyltransferase